MSVKIPGELEIDEERGVLYFHSYRTGCSTLRVCGLGKRLVKFAEMTQLDISLDVPPPHHFIVSRSDVQVPSPKNAEGPRNFFLNEQHTTHITKSQARKERQEVQRSTFKKLYGKKTKKKGARR